MKFDINAMIQYFPKAMIGWLCVFIVTAVVIASILILNKVTSHNKGQ